MARQTSKARLENGLKLDINNLARRGIVMRGATTGPVVIAWNSDYWGEVGQATISADMSSRWHGWMKIQTKSADQRINLRAEGRSELAFYIR